MESVNRILHYPQLDTVLMVEKFIQKHDREFRKRKLWESLPKKMQYQTFVLTLDYLLYSGKISIDSEGKVGWIYYPKKVEETLKHKELFINLGHTTPAFLKPGEPNRLQPSVGKMGENTGKIIQILRSLREQIRRNYKAEVIGVFGSYARGEERGKSDLDLLVRFLQGANFFDFVGLSDFLEEKLGLKVDIVSERAVRKELKESILKEVLAV